MPDRRCSCAVSSCAPQPGSPVCSWLHALRKLDVLHHQIHGKPHIFLSLRFTSCPPCPLTCSPDHACRAVIIYSPLHMQAWGSSIQHALRTTSRIGLLERS